MNAGIAAALPLDSTRLRAALEEWNRPAARNADARRRILQLLTDDHDLDRAEVEWCLGHIHAHLIGKYQGTIAELLAERAVDEWLRREVAEGRLGPDVTPVWGNRIRQQRGTAPEAAWNRGADALLIVGGVDAPTLRIVGVVEVKSYRGSLMRFAAQAAAHIERLRTGGLRIDERTWSPDRLSVAWWTGRSGWTAGAAKRDWRRVIRLVVIPAAPPTRLQARRPAPRGPIITLACTRAEIAAEAYRRSALFLEEFAQEAGLGVATGEHDGNAPNAVREALYHINLDRRGIGRVQLGYARRLYNVYGFGYAAAEGKREMMWSEPVAAPPVAGGVTETMSLPDMMSRFYVGDFAGFVRVVPEPGAKPSFDDGWWAKKLLALIRSHTRLGNADAARRLLDRLDADQSKWSFVPIASPAAYGALCLLRGDLGEARQAAARSEAALDALRTVMRDRAVRGLDDPLWHEGHGVHAAILDLAALLTQTGRRERAVTIIERLGGVFPPLVSFARVDPALQALWNDAELSPRLEAWSVEAAD